MTYELIYSESFLKQMKKLPQQTQKHIYAVLERCRIRPDHFATQLVGSKYSRLRAGNYRIIVNIDNGKLTILVLEVEHRKKIYKKK